MEQSRRDFTTMVLAIPLGISASGILLVGKCCASKEPNTRKATTNQESKQDSVLYFKEMASKKGVTSDGSPFSSQIHESSDGVELSVMRENRASHVRASKELHRKLQEASKIIERGSKLDDRGRRVGERVLALFAARDSHEDQVSILWTDGAQLYYIESSSLRHLLAFEKKYYR